ncbi:MAG: hypothetical protein ABW321_00525 [Polyangiales bacterium]
MAAEDERKPGKPGAPPESSGSERETRDARDTREPREQRDTRLPLGELLRRGISAGQAVSESLFPRELAGNLASQLVDARHGLVNAIASEVGRFLRQADIASEMRKVLAGLNIEAKIQLKFSEDPQGQIKSELEVQRTSVGQRAANPPQAGSTSSTGSGGSGSKSKPPPPRTDDE